MAKLKEDEIKTVYMLEASDAQQKLHALKKTNQELASVMDRRRKEMIKLESQGKKNSIEYKNLEKANRESSQSIRENTKLIRSQEEAMGVNSLTMNQLKSRAKSLRIELNNISKELDPDRWARVNRKLSETTDRMTSLRTNASELNKNMSGSIFSRNTFASFWGNLYAQLALKIGESLHKVREFIAESTRLAAQAQGIDHAFSRIANRDYLKSLRDQTKGLVSDFTLMKSAVRAENFDIPLTQLGRLLEFAQNRARDTGESVDYLVESIILGIGRKSPLILDNLGISAVKLRNEVKKTGDMATAVGNIIEEEMAQAGTAIDTAADAATRKKVAWENLMLATGKFFTGFKGGWDNFMTNFLNGVTEIISKSDDAVKKYDDQIQKVAELDMSIGSLAARYDILKTNGDLSNEEQRELNKIMNQLVEVVPKARGKFDDYGRIVSINTTLVREYIEAERARISMMRAAALEQAKKDEEEAKRNMERAKAEVEQGGKAITRTYGRNMVITETFIDESTLAQSIKDYREWGKKYEEAQKFTSDISGKTYELEEDKRYKFNNTNLQQLKAWIDDEKNAKDEYLTIAKEVYNARIALEAVNTNPENDKGKTKAELDKEAYNGAIAELEAYIAHEKALIQQNYIAGKMSREEYNRELEYLELEKLRKNLEISGLTFEQQQEIELKIFESKKLMLKSIEDEERAHQQRLIDVQKQADDARAKQNWEALKKVAKQNEENWEKERDRENKRKADLAAIGFDFANQMGSMVGSALSGNEDILASSLKSIISMALDALKIQVEIAAAGATAQSLALPDSVASYGAAGFARAAIIVGAIEAAFAAVKGMVNGTISKIVRNNSDNSNPSSDSPGTGSYVVTGRQSGGYVDITRDQDGKYFRALINHKKRGFIDRPTVIVGDGPAGKSKEWVASNDALENPTVAPIIKLLNEAQQAGNIRTIDLNHIMRTRMAGFESGGFINRNAQDPSTTPLNTSRPNQVNTVDYNLMGEVRDFLAYLKNNGVFASVSLSDLQRKQELLNKSQKIGRK